MYSTDQQAFGLVLDRLATVFGRELTNELRTLYWDALKDLALSTVQTMAAAHIKRGRFFPKPFELRPAEQRVVAMPLDSEAFKAAERLAFKRLEELRVTDPAEWLRQVRPKVLELGAANGMLAGEIESKLERYLREGPR